MNATTKVLREFIKETFLFGEEITFSDDDSFLEMGTIDSTGVLELVMFLESHFHITVDDEELVPENLDSINNLIGFVNGKIARPAPLDDPLQAGTSTPTTPCTDNALT